MSVRNPLRIIKEKIRSLERQAYHVRGLRKVDEIAEFVYKGLTDELSPTLLKQVWLSSIVDMLTNKIERLEYEQLDFWRGDYYWPVKRSEGRVQVALSDLTLPDIAQIERRKDANIEAAMRERARFARHVEIIKPLLLANDTWTWGMAVDWLERNGGLPDLD